MHLQHFRGVELRPILTGRDPGILVEITGIEPVVGKPGGFTVHCITIDASSPEMNL